MDALSEVLRDARLSGGVFLHGTFSEPWCFASTVTAADCSTHLGPTDHLILLHYVIEGTLKVTLPDTEPVLFSPGQAAIFPNNDRHKLSGVETTKSVVSFDQAAIPTADDLMVIEAGGGGATTRIMCGFLGSRLTAADPLFFCLPPLLRFDCATERSGVLVRTSFELAAHELSTGRAGTDAMLARLSELLFVEAIRSHVERRMGEVHGFLAALQDRSLNKAVALLHRSPERQWTIPELARTVGASRSSLTEKFRHHLNCTPIGYLTRHRMQLASWALETTNLSLLEIAARVGYGSEAAFSRAFKRANGMSPSSWRAHHNVDPERAKQI